MIVYSDTWYVVDDGDNDDYDNNKILCLQSYKFYINANDKTCKL